MNDNDWMDRAEYELGEADAEIERLTTENADLRKKLDNAGCVSEQRLGRDDGSLYTRTIYTTFRKALVRFSC